MVLVEKVNSLISQSKDTMNTSSRGLLMLVKMYMVTDQLGMIHPFDWRAKVMNERFDQSSRVKRVVYDQPTS